MRVIAFSGSLPPILARDRCRFLVSQACVVWLAALISVTSGCSKNGSPVSVQPASLPQVCVRIAVQTNVPVAWEIAGHASPFSSVAIRSQVCSVLEGVHFKEGDRVKAGELLFTLDRQPFADALAQAKSNLERDLSLQNQAATEREENAVLLKSRIVSKDNYNESAAYAESLKATVTADRAMVDSAERELSYCQIRSPVDGRAGFLQVSPGNLVQIGEMVLVMINQTQPIFVDFPISEQDLASVRNAAARKRLEVRAVAGLEAKPSTGELVAIDNTVDPNSRAVFLRARFPNDNEAFWPGQSVKVELSLQTSADAVLISREAVHKSPSGEFVFVVNPDSTLATKVVQTGGLVGKELMICRGLNPGERVVTKAEAGVAPGAQVRCFEIAHTGR